MKQVGFVHLEVEKGDHKFVFEMPMGAPYADAVDAAFQMFKTVDKMCREALDKEIAEYEKEEEKSDS